MARVSVLSMIRARMPASCTSDSREGIATRARSRQRNSGRASTSSWILPIWSRTWRVRVRESTKRMISGSRCRERDAVPLIPLFPSAIVIGHRPPNSLLPIRNVRACHESSICKKSFSRCYHELHFRYQPQRGSPEARFRYTFVTVTRKKRKEDSSPRGWNLLL